MSERVLRKKKRFYCTKSPHGPVDLEEIAQARLHNRPVKWKALKVDEQGQIYWCGGDHDGECEWAEQPA
jgi:hypothetical protein